MGAVVREMEMIFRNRCLNKNLFTCHNLVPTDINYQLKAVQCDEDFRKGVWDLLVK